MLWHLCNVPCAGISESDDTLSQKTQQRPRYKPSTHTQLTQVAPLKSVNLLFHPEWLVYMKVNHSTDLVFQRAKWSHSGRSDSSSGRETTKHWNGEKRCWITQDIFSQTNTLLVYLNVFLNVSKWCRKSHSTCRDAVHSLPGSVLVRTVSSEFLK